MRRFALALPLAALAAAGFANQAVAQEMKSRGTIVAMTADAITVKVGTTDLKFGVDGKTHVEAVGGSTATQKAAAAGKPGPKLSDVLKIGDAVEVSYRDAANRHADSIRKVSTPGSGGVPARVATGTVAAVSNTALSINGSSGGGGTFSQTYTIDDKTRIVAHGATTKTASTGGRATASSLVGMGDRVSVSFDEAGSALHATEIRVIAKKP